MDSHSNTQNGSGTVHMLRVLGPVVVALALTNVMVADAKAPSGKCRSRKGTILAQGPLAVAYKVRHVIPGTAGKLRATDLFGCLRSTGRKRTLAFEDEFFDRPARAVAVHGSTVGYVSLEVADGAGPPDQTIINLEPMKKPRSAGLRQFYLEDNSAVGGLDITNRGAAAWVECPEEGFVSDCVRGKDVLKRVVATVVVRGYGTTALELGQGKTIRARSIRIDHKNRANQRVSWVQKGRRRSRPLLLATTP